MKISDEAKDLFDHIKDNIPVSYQMALSNYAITEIIQLCIDEMQKDRERPFGAKQFYI